MKIRNTQRFRHRGMLQNFSLLISGEQYLFPTEITDLQRAGMPRMKRGTANRRIYRSLISYGNRHCSPEKRRIVILQHSFILY